MNRNQDSMVGSLSCGQHFFSIFHCRWKISRFTWIAFTASISIVSFASAGLNCNGYDIKCVNGRCVNDVQTKSKLNNDTKSNDINKTPKVVCLCDDRWSGSSCEIFSCNGRMYMQSPEGVITDGTGNYTLDKKCIWLIDGGVNLPLRLKFDEFATECGWDHLYIFNGNSVSAPLIGVFSGLIIPKYSPDKVIPELTASSGMAYLHFYSDAAYNMSGFTIRYSYTACSENCSGNGDCLANGTCQCYDGWSGVGCTNFVCPNNCSAPNGTCYMNGCQCDQGYRGVDCSVPEYKGFWTNVKFSGLNRNWPQAVASHSTIIYKKNLYVIGGYTFQSFDSSLQTSMYNFDKKTWETVNTGSDPPQSRYGHSLARYADEVFMFGGVIGNTITSELWRLDLLSSRWFPVPQLDSTLILATVGHTVQVVGNVMFVFFGHNPVYGFLNTVQCFNFDNLSWSIITTSGALIKGGYGHSSVYDPVSKVILIHGGYQSESATNYSLTDVLYAFNTSTYSWKKLHSSGQFKFLHSAAILSGFMFVYGGNTHNDTSISQGAKCYSSDFMAYDIVCDRWYVLDPPSLMSNVARYGHSADVYNGNMYVYGGFNGLLLNDLIIYQPGMCSGYKSPVDCLNSNVQGIKCVTVNDIVCTTPETAIAMQIYKNIEIINTPTCNPLATHVCSGIKTCLSCTVNSQRCVWCNDECQPDSTCNSPEKALNEAQCLTSYPQQSSSCFNLHNCQACTTDPSCSWNSSSNKCDVIVNGQIQPNRTCSPACLTYSACENCTQSLCMWCSNQRMCVESNSYVASFPYGQCMEWTTFKPKCSVTHCQDFRTCSQCQDNNPACGWCDDGTNTGLGRCMEGGLDGPIDINQCTNQEWYFTSCPLCQCNGHSNCSENSSVCLSCNDMTAGDNCEYCSEGYWGQAAFGGNCTECKCNSQADFCNHDSGSCYCRTRGVIGDHCQECDKAHKYFGDPLMGTCYYELAIDWIFTFNLSSEENKYYTEINFMNTPPMKYKDVDFSISCSTEASMNISVKSASEPEQFLFINYTCTSFVYKFLHEQYDFGSDQNTTFYVYIYNFRTPFTLQMYFSQNEHLDLFKFFITFFSCFFSLLLIAFVSWKMKQKYDIHRRGQRHVEEMAQMANRPFSSCALELEQPNNNVVLQEQPDVKFSAKHKRECKATPVAVQPIFGHKAAILSVIVCLPKGDEDYTPSDQCALAIASALVTLGVHHSRQSNVIDPSKTDRMNKYQKKMNTISNATPNVV